MSKWFYYNESGEKIEVTGGQLKGLAKAGRITPDTIVETEDGKTAPARKVKGLVFTETAQSETSRPLTQAPPVVSNLLHCTNCGASIAEHAIACLSCGASPTGHKKFCRHCGVALNPEQIICIKCGVVINAALRR